MTLNFDSQELDLVYFGHMSISLPILFDLEIILALLVAYNSEVNPVANYGMMILSSFTSFIHSFIIIHVQPQLWLF